MTGEPSPTQEPTPAEVFQRLIDGISAGRWHDVADLYADDVVVEMPMDPQRTRLGGREAVRERFAAAGSGPFELRAHHIVVHVTTDPEVVIAEFQYDGLNRTTGITFTVANVQLLRVRRGRIVASRDYHDHAGFAASRGR
jgi:ketosteroid isomerase-like protein